MRCVEDNMEFVPKQPYQVFCSNRCRWRVQQRRRYKRDLEYKARQINKGRLARIKAVEEGRCHRCLHVLPEGCGKVCPECREVLSRNKGG